MWQDILKSFLGIPERYYNDYPIGYMLRSESIHYLCSVFLGSLGFFLILTILFRRHSEWGDRSIWWFSFVFGLAVSVTVHICIDIIGIA